MNAIYFDPLYFEHCNTIGKLISLNEMHVGL